MAAKTMLGATPRIPTLISNDPLLGEDLAEALNKAKAYADAQAKIDIAAPAEGTSTTVGAGLHVPESGKLPPKYIPYDFPGPDLFGEYLPKEFEINLVICADGTWERPDGNVDDGADTRDKYGSIPSNITKISLMTREGLVPDDTEFNISGGRDGKQRKFREQMVFYRAGVASTANKLAATTAGITGLGAGVGLDEQLKDLYLQPKINCFSLVSAVELMLMEAIQYCVRALSAWILNCGILRRENLHMLEKSFQLFSRRDYGAQPGYLESQVFIRNWSHYFPDRQGLVKLERFASLVDDDNADHSTDPEKFESTEEELGSKLQPRLTALVTPVTFLGVFDTVGALGNPLIPRRKAKKIHDNPEAANPFFSGHLHAFFDVQLLYHVVNARHALALTERRSAFEPSIWKLDRPAAKVRALTGRTVKQVWFLGGHGDIGGGWVEEGLSDITLRWMVGEAKSYGLSTIVEDVFTRPYVQHPNPISSATPKQAEMFIKFETMFPHLKDDEFIQDDRHGPTSKQQPVAATAAEHTTAQSALFAPANAMSREKLTAAAHTQSALGPSTHAHTTSNGLDPASYSKSSLTVAHQTPSSKRLSFAEALPSIAALNLFGTSQKEKDAKKSTRRRSVARNTAPSAYTVLWDGHTVELNRLASKVPESDFYKQEFINRFVRWYPHKIGIKDWESLPQMVEGGVEGYRWRRIYVPDPSKKGDDCIVINDGCPNTAPDGSDPDTTNTRAHPAGMAIHSSVRDALVKNEDSDVEHDALVDRMSNWMRAKESKVRVPGSKSSKAKSGGGFFKFGVRKAGEEYLQRLHAYLTGDLELDVKDGGKVVKKVLGDPAIEYSFYLSERLLMMENEG
ncbi:hypothetical protein HDU93_001842 [Gonapodya sp. JEL0774]|nr:hypothetical protein HDU93_001842 [Gonapodya sp. JEL0774]